LGVSVRVWDLLRPTSRSCVASVTVHDGGCGALLAHPSRPLLISGGIKGDICLTSTLSWRPLCTIPAHKGAVKCMTLVPPACIRQHTSAYVSIRQLTPAYVRCPPLARPDTGAISCQAPRMATLRSGIWRPWRWQRRMTWMRAPWRGARVFST
jgi:hypothetical protein